MHSSIPVISDAKLALKSRISEQNLLSERKKGQLRFVLRLFSNDSRDDSDDVCQITWALLEAENARGARNDNMMRPSAQANADRTLSLEEFILTLGQLVRPDPASVATFPDRPVSSATSDEDQWTRIAEEIAQEKLSPREIDVLKLLMDGDSNKQVARKLNIAEPTVKCHVKSILRKLNARNRFEAAMWAMKMKLGRQSRN